MEDLDFIAAVAEMRKWQIAFFAAKHKGIFDKNAFDRSRDYERIVDKELQRRQSANVVEFNQRQLTLAL